MTVDELASELYELIVVKGRWGGERRKTAILGNTYDTQPEWMKDLWRDEAKTFAFNSGFALTEN